MVKTRFKPGEAQHFDGITCVPEELVSWQSFNNLWRGYEMLEDGERGREVAIREIRETDDFNNAAREQHAARLQRSLELGQLHPEISAVLTTYLTNGIRADLSTVIPWVDGDTFNSLTGAQRRRDADYPFLAVSSLIEAVRSYGVLADSGLIHGDLNAMNIMMVLKGDLNPQQVREHLRQRIFPYKAVFVDPDTLMHVDDHRYRGEGPPQDLRIHAPEVLRGDGFHIKSDIRRLGIEAVMIEGLIPIYSGTLTREGQQFHENMKAFIARAILDNPDDRPDAKEAIEMLGYQPVVSEI